MSRTSAASVIGALNPDEFDITVIGITKGGKLAGSDELQTMLPAPLLSRVRSIPAFGSDGMWISGGCEPPSAMHDPPVVYFPLLHGPYGEDGTIQGLLEIAGLPYIGCGVLASAVAMDKDVAKRLFLQEGLPATPYKTVYADDLVGGVAELEKSAARELGYPMFSKPANLGSSVGVCKIHSPEEFEPSVRYSAQFDRKILIEKGIDGRELECAILGNDNPQASVVGEILSANEFYDYEAKYVNPESRTEIPARIPPEKAEEIRELALRSFRAIDGSGLARVDFFLERNTDKVWINEINTMPGFTPISMYSKLWAASGVGFEDLVRRLIRFGEERHQERAGKRISV